MGFFLETQERLRDSRVKRAISVRATEGLCNFSFCRLARQELDCFWQKHF